MAAAFEAFSGFIETGVNAISSVVSDFGDIFLTADPTGIVTEAVSPLDFGVPVDELASFGAWEQAGSLAGNATWFDTFNAGDIVGAAGSVADSFGFAPVLEGEFGGIIDAAGSVSDGFGFAPVLEGEFGGIVDAAGSVSSGFGFPDVLEQPAGLSIKSIATQVKQDFTGFIKDAQAAFQTYQKFAPVVNVVSSALGIPNPVNQILQPLGQAVGIAGAAAGVAGAVETGNVRAAVTNPAVVSAAVGLIGGSSTVPIARGIGTGVSLYNTVQILGSRVPVANATSVGGSTGYTVVGGVAQPNLLEPELQIISNGVVGGTFRELSIEETRQLTRNATLINNLVDPGVQSPLNWNTAIETVETLSPVVINLQRQVEDARSVISVENENIISFQNQLNDPDLTEEQRIVLEDRIQASYDIIAQQQESIDNTEPLIISTSDQIAQAERIVATTTSTAIGTASPVTVVRATPQYIQFYDPETGSWSVFNNDTGTTVQTGLTERQALNTAQLLEINSGSTLRATAEPIADLGEIVITAPRLQQDVTAQENSITTALTNAARDQQTLRNLRNTKAQSSDWRVRLSLAPNSNYLYNDTQPGLLAPLKNTNGVIFPYTPSIETAYKANYDAYDLTHSNYRGYFYKNSYVDAVNLRATFTAQDTNEANYLLAVIHFFRSCTKMFYGQDTERGAPPPLVYIKGYGDFQFNNHPCLVSQFNYTLPTDVDYIRAQSILSNNTNLQLARLRNTIANNPLSYSVNRVLNSGLLPGALDFRPSTTNNIGVGNPTYVPTKIEISVSLLPIQSRQQISKNFSVKEFATGNLLRGGYW